MIMKHCVLSFSIIILYCLSATAQTQVVAHRGFWKTEGAAQNSIASLTKAADIGCFGSEFDVHMTRDNVLVVNHDRTIQGITIQKSSYEELRSLQLKNGEPLPTLEQYLSKGKELEPLRLVLEIKSHETATRENQVVDAILRMVKRMRLKKRVDYISFSRHVCKRLAKKAPRASVTYLEGDLSPQEVKRLRFDGIDYEQKVLRSHPEWISECHRLGLTVNVWTVNNEEDIRYFVEQGVDLITTNEPIATQQIINEKNP